MRVDSSDFSKKIYYFLIFPLGLLLYVLAGNLSNDIYLPSMPHLVEAFGVSMNALQLSLTAWFLGASLPQLILGPAADKLGLKRILWAGAACFLIGTLLCLMGFSYTLFLIGRFLEGLGVCSITVVSFSSLEKLYQIDSHRVKILSLLNICHATAPLLGPLLGAYIIIFSGWQMTFLCVILISLIGLSMIAVTMPALKVQNSPISFSSILSNYSEIIKFPTLLSSLLSYSFLFGSLVIFLTGGPFLFENTFGLSQKAFGISQIGIFGGFILGSFFTLKMNARLSNKKLLQISRLLITTGILCLMTYVLLVDNPSVRCLLPLVMLSLGFGIIAGPLTNIIIKLSKTHVGLLSALIGLGMTGMGCMGSLVCSFLFNGSPRSLVMLISIAASCATISLTILSRSEELDSP